MSRSLFNRSRTYGALEQRILEEQSTLTAEVNIQQVVWSAIALVGVLLIAVTVVSSGIYYWQHSDPYVQKVLAIRGEQNRGHSIFQLNCAGCHGTWADGKVGPSLHGVSSRRSEWSLIQQITSGKTPPMPKFQASPQEMADLLSYLKTL
jgi:mono/diheme cytochrome c family protein